MSTVQAYLFFDGRCEEAIEFYKKTLGATVDMVMRYKDSPEPPRPGHPAPPPDKVMHAAFRIGDSQVLASDGFAGGKPKFEGFSLTIVAGDDADTQRKFGALSEGGSVAQALVETFFSTSFGMCTDRFGVHWMVMAETKAGGHG